jgi:hypothetical protein
LKTTLSNTNSLAEAIAVSGNDVYVVGRDYNAALRLDPNDAAAYYSRGWAYWGKKDYRRAVGVIFIPFCLWDGTKSFTAKLVTLFTSYFIKIMVMVLCLFWVYSAFIYMGVSIMSSNEPVSFLSFAYFIFTCLLGWVVTQNDPQEFVALRA